MTFRISSHTDIKVLTETFPDVADEIEGMRKCVFSFSIGILFTWLISPQC
jgi:hypothetical protein